jgi:hypothetical protein
LKAQSEPAVTAYGALKVQGCNGICKHKEVCVGPVLLQALFHEPVFMIQHLL